MRVSREGMGGEVKEGEGRDSMEMEGMDGAS